MKGSAMLHKNIKALFALGFFIAVACSVAGGAVMILGHSRAPQATIPVWEHGKFMMLCGLCNLFVYACLLFQFRTLTAAKSGTE